MFEQAAKFREKYSIPLEAQNSLRILEEEANIFKEKISQLKSQISILKREIYCLESDINEFLMDYYERVSTIFLSGDSDNEDIFLSKFSQNVIEDEEVFTLDASERRQDASDKELKQVYRRLVKIYHPDASSLGQSDISSKNKFNEITQHYKEKNLDALFLEEFSFYEQSNFDSYNFNIVRKIEEYENKERELSLAVDNLNGKLKKIVKSPEYRLFMKKKICDIRGEDFYKKIIC
jgi:hypothetical protein